MQPQRSGGTVVPRASSFERSAARYLAALTGGFVTEVGTVPGHTLERLLTVSDDGYVFRLRAPVTGRRLWDGMPHTLNMNDRAEKLSFRRGFTVSEEGSVETSDEALDRGGDHLFYYLPAIFAWSGAVLANRAHLPLLYFFHGRSCPLPHPKCTF